MNPRTVVNFINRNKIVVLLMLMTVVSAITFAQEEAVQIELPVEDMLTYLNQWIGVFGPIFLFIGMIPVALGLLRYVLKLFASAFSGGGR
jgi:hypothetical protein